MKSFISPELNPFFNLALEECLFNEIESEFLLMYRNTDSVVVGKHQNANAEANQSWLFENKVPLIRRFSGGGTVYHDSNNINFSFITSGKDSRVIDFKKYAGPVVEILNDAGIPAELTERNDIFVEGKKVSGHAAHAKGKRSLHHGTLLFDADLLKLSASLKSDRDRYESKAVQSVRSPVTNLKDFQKNHSNVESFQNWLSVQLNEAFNCHEDWSMIDSFRRKVEDLAKEKYETSDWNYGYSPNYVFNFKIVLNSMEVKGKMTVEKGRIMEISISEKNSLTRVIENLNGQFHYLPDFEREFNKNFNQEETKSLLNTLF